MSDTVRLVTFSSIDYRTAWQWQQETAADVRNGGPESLALLQHTPVYTFGRSIHREHLLVVPAEIRHQGADLVESDRGGDITFHGPGQLIGYPILDLHRRQMTPTGYVRALEETLIRATCCFGLEPCRQDGRPGVWVRGAKLGAVGVRVQKGVSTHGFALNVHTDLSWFDAIVPCGIRDASVTSMDQLLREATSFDAVQLAVADAFEAVFSVRLLRAGVATSSGHR